MKKMYVFLLCLLVASLALAGCGKSGGTEATDNGGAAAGPDATAAPADSSQEKVKISIYYPTPDQTEKRALEDDKIKRFQEKYPNVVVEKSDWQYNPNEIGIKMAANEAPTLFNTYATEGRFLAQRGWAADITELWNNWQYKDDMNPILQTQFMIDGKVYGIAQQGYVTGVAVNKKMFADKGVQLPGYDWTWDDMYNAVKAVSDPAKGISGIAPMGKGNEAGWNWTNFLFEAGGEIQQVDNGKVTAAFNSEAGLKALQFYHKLKWEGNAIPQSWALNWGDAVGSFAQGRTAMVIAGPDGPIDQALNQGGMKLDDVTVYPMPAAQAGGKHTGVLGGDYLVINPNAAKAEQEAAFNYAVFDYFSDKGLESVEASIQQRITDNKYFVPPVIQYFKPGSDYDNKVQSVYAKYDNVYVYDVNMLNLLDGKPEAQYNTQDYYATMTNVVQAVFSKKDENLQAQLDAAAKLVQAKFYDTLKIN